MMNESTYKETLNTAGGKDISTLKEACVITHDLIVSLITSYFMFLFTVEKPSSLTNRSNRFDTFQRNQYLLLIYINVR